MRARREKIKQFQETIWDFYKKFGRDDLPWRKDTSAYAVVVSEIMLQQTQVDRVIPFFKKWMKNFPNWKQLASARQGDVLRHWKGLGYNSRALRLHQLAKIIRKEYSGRLPEDRDTLEDLPGIGPYTAGAIRAFVFNEPEVFIETNIRRIYIHHFFNNKKSISDEEVLALVEKTLPLKSRARKKDPRNWYWALMDYGSILAKEIPNPNRKSKHYTKQSKFKGSDRQIRGKILEILLDGKKNKIDDIVEKLGEKKKRIQKIITDLEKEGFVEIDGKVLRLKN